jgi:hypothetical protein
MNWMIHVLICKSMNCQKRQAELIELRAAGQCKLQNCWKKGSIFGELEQEKTKDNKRNQKIPKDVFLLIKDKES